MPHQCVRCNSFYEDGAREILTGCKCGGRLFFYIKKSKIEQAKQITNNLTDKDKQQIETDVMDIMGDKCDKDAPVVLDLEAIRILEPGRFELDLVHLFKKNDPLIYKLAEGKYMIDIPATFDRRNKDKSEEKK